MLDCQLFGLDAGGHHWMNVALHAITAVLLFLLLRQMTGRLWPCALVAALFAIHPLRVESVAWISERKDVLSGLFFVLTLGAYVRYVRAPAGSRQRRRADAGMPGRADMRRLRAVRLGLVGQTDAGDVADGPAVVGLLAVAALAGCRNRAGTSYASLTVSLRLAHREDPPAAALGGRFRADRPHPGRGHPVAGEHLLAGPQCQCPGGLRELPGLFFLAAGAGRSLSASHQRFFGRHGLRSGRDPGGGIGRRVRLADGRRRTCSSAGCGIWECSSR